MLADDLARACLLRGSFPLHSGAVSDRYFDKYAFESDPRLLRRVMDALALRIPAGTELLAGLELGGIPIATGLSLVTGLPAVFVRKQPKPYGTCRQVEGCAVADRCVCVIEDVVTSGGAVLAAVAALRAEGATVQHALCVVERTREGAALLAHNGVRLSALYRLRGVTLAPLGDTAVPAPVQRSRTAVGRRDGDG